MIRLIFIAAACAAAVIASPQKALSATTKSLDYTFEYNAAGAGSASSLSSSYSTVSMVVSDGVDASAAVSSDYSFVAVPGAASAPANVSDWSLY